MDQRRSVIDVLVIAAFMVANLVVLAVVLREAVGLAPTYAAKAVVTSAAAGAGVFATCALAALLAHLRRNRIALYPKNVAGPGGFQE